MNSSAPPSVIQSSESPLPASGPGNRPRAVLEQAVLVGILVTLSWHYFSPQVWTLPALVGWLALAAIAGNRAVIHFALFAALIFAAPRLFPVFPSHVVAKTSVLAAYVLVLLCLPAFRKSIGWWRIGTYPRRTLLSVGFSLTGFALFAWWYVSRHPPSGSAQVLPSTQSASTWVVYLLAGAALNALFEEIFWRGLMQDAIASVWRVAALALVVQAVQFGIAHFRGPFFAGWSGVLATAIFGLWLGHLRQRTSGLLVPWFVHFCSDAILIVTAEVVRR